MKTSKYTPRMSLLGKCNCFDGQGDNCDMECRECQSSTNYTFSINNTVYEAMNAVCDKGRGLCECLAPYIGIKKHNVTQWFRNKTEIVFERIYGTPKNNTLKVKMMQGKQAFMQYVSKMTNVDLFMEQLELDPTQFNLSIHDVRLLNVYADTSATYNYNCNSTCPGTTDFIPCSGHGYCSLGQCICDVAEILKTDSLQVESKYDTSGWRGIDCSIKCPGYDGNMTNVCSGHGECNTKGNCQCNEVIQVTLSIQMSWLDHMQWSWNVYFHHNSSDQQKARILQMVQMSPWYTHTQMSLF